MAARSEAEANSLLVYKSPAWKGGVLYSSGDVRSELQPRTEKFGIAKSDLILAF